VFRRGKLINWIYTYIYIERERGPKPQQERGRGGSAPGTYSEPFSIHGTYITPLHLFSVFKLRDDCILLLPTYIYMHIYTYI